MNEAVCIAKTYKEGRGTLVAETHAAKVLELHPPRVQVHIDVHWRYASIAV